MMMSLVTHQAPLGCEARRVPSARHWRRSCSHRICSADEVGIFALQRDHCNRIIDRCSECATPRRLKTLLIRYSVLSRVSVLIFSEEEHEFYAQTVAERMSVKPRFYDFFAGAGLVEAALNSSWECVWANDIDRRKAEIYALNFSDDHYLLGDVAEVCAEQLPTNVEMAWSSFPCQDLSLAGWRRGMGAGRSGTFWAFWRIMHDLLVKDRRPPILVLENVVGLLYGANFSGLCEALAALDMKFGAVVIDAEKFVPQSRPRVFVIAVDRHVDVSAFTSGEPPKSSWISKRLLQSQHELSPELRERWLWWNLPEAPSRQNSITDLIEEHPTGGKWHTDEQTQNLLEMMTDLNLSKVEEALQSLERAVGFLYRRTREGKQRAEVRFDGIAGCLRTPNGGSSRQTVMIIENGSIRSRLLSPREAARLMGVEDTYKLLPRYNDSYWAMGDGVAVPAVRFLSENLLKPLVHQVRVVEPRTEVVALEHHRLAAEKLEEQWRARA